MAEYRLAQVRADRAFHGRTAWPARRRGGAAGAHGGDVL